MSKYYKAEDVINTLADQWHFEATIEHPYAADDIEEWKENARELFADLPSIEVSEDCTSRKWLEENKQVVSHTNEWGETEINEYICWEDVEDAPSVAPSCQKNRQVERAEGEWIIEEKDSIYGKKIRLTCSECGDVFDVSEAAFPYEIYCRYCGAKMKG